jgi:hypothetical protein
MHHTIQHLKNSKNETYVTIYYDDTLEAVVDVWTGSFENPENFYEGLGLVLTTIETHHAKKWLADLSQIQGDFAFARGFITAEVIPTAMKHGLLFEALVLPDDIFAMLSVSEAMQMVDHLQIRLFGTVDEATAWLNSKIC